MKQILIGAALVAAMGATVAGELYRWVDKQGVVHYGDYPKVEDAERVTINVPPGEQAASGASAASGVGAIPYEARLAAQHFPVTLYVFANCDDLCKQARAYLQKRKVPYAEHVIKTQEEFADLQKKAQVTGLPALTVGSTWLRGFAESAWGDELDAAGYPK